MKLVDKYKVTVYLGVAHPSVAIQLVKYISYSQIKSKRLQIKCTTLTLKVMLQAWKWNSSTFYKNKKKDNMKGGANSTTKEEMKHCIKQRLFADEYSTQW